MSGNMLLEARGVFKNYGPIKVLKDVNLSLETGDRHVVIGPNGAGKSTLFKVLSGEVLPTSGQILIDGKDVTYKPSYGRVPLGVGRSFQVARIFKDMSVIDNVVIAVEARLRRSRQRPSPFAISANATALREARSLLEQLAIAALEHTRSADLSHGDRKRLELAMLLALQPRILMLDEPTAGMSSTDRAVAVNLIDELVRDNGLTLLLTEHDMGVVFQLGTKLSVLNYGELVITGNPEEVRANPVVRDIYLGRRGSDA